MQNISVVVETSSTLDGPLRRCERLLQLNGADAVRPISVVWISAEKNSVFSASTPIDR
jgi:hypothetical protein